MDFILILASLLFSIETFASETPRFYQNWVKYPTQKSGEVKFQVLKRYIPLPGQPVSIGEVSLMEIPKGKSFSVEGLSEDVRLAMGFKAWTIRRVGNARVFEQDWKEARRFYRLYVLENEKSIRFSIATFRSSYARSMTLESEFIQRNFIEGNPDHYDWAKDLFSRIHQVVLPEASAQSDVISAMGKLSSGMGELNSTLSGMNSNLGSKFDSLSEQMKGFSSSLGSLNANWAESNKLITSTSQAWIDEVNKMGSPKNVALTGAIGAGAAVLGGTAMNMAISGVKWGVTEMARVLTGYYREKDQATRVQLFKEAREKYYKSKDSINALESAIDGYIALFENAKLTHVPIDQVLKNLSDLNFYGQREYNKMDRWLTQYEDTGKLPEGCNLKPEVLGKQMSQLASLLDSMKSLKTNLSGVRSIQNSCETVKAVLLQLAEAEQDLEKSRMELLDNLPNYIEDRRRELLASSQLASKLSSGADDKRLDNAVGKSQKTVKDLATQQIQEAREAFLDQCHQSIKDFPEARDGKHSRVRFCKDLFKNVNEKMLAKFQEREAGVDVSDQMKGALADALGDEIKSNYQQATPIEFQKKLEIALKSPMTGAVNAVLIPKESLEVVKNAKAGTRSDRKTSSDNHYRVDLSLFSDVVSGALDLKKDFEKSLDAVEEMDQERNRDLTKKIEGLARFQDRKKKLEDLCPKGL